MASKGDAKKTTNGTASHEELQDVTYNEHNLSISELEEKWSVKIKDGLTTEQVLENRSKYGENRITPPPKTPEWVKVRRGRCLCSPLIMRGLRVIPDSDVSSFIF